MPEETKNNLSDANPQIPSSVRKEKYSVLSVFLGVVIGIGGLMLGVKILNDLKRAGETSGEKILFESVLIVPLIIITVIASRMFGKEEREKYAPISIPYGIIMAVLTIKYLIFDMLPVLYEMNKTLTIYASLILLVGTATFMGFYLQRKHNEDKA